MELPIHPEEQLFEAARELSDPAEREAFVRAACAGNVSLFERIGRLLRADAGADRFFAESADALKESILDEPFVEKPGSRIGRYKLLQQLGEGGCGAVYMAEQEEPVQRSVALKVIKLGMDTKNVVARFEAERQALALMDHPNIARVLDAGATENGRPFFVMELVRGVKITDYCDQNHLSTRERLELFIQVCQGVQHAHQKGVIHRDLKPSNILVTTSDGVAIPKIIDFGIAKATERRLTDLTLFTAFEQLLGTPAYMSPEQAVMTSVDIDTRSDIYSLGVLLYELLTGKTPFDSTILLGFGIDELRRTIREKEPARPSTRLRDLPQDELTTAAANRRSEAPRLIYMVRGDLDWIVMKCLEKDRSRRYATANGLALEIERYLKNEPILARPPDLLYQVGKAIRRKKLVFVSALVIAGSLLISVVAISRGAMEAKRARLAERKQRLAAEANLYVANMQLIQRAWEQDDIVRVRQLLAETGGYPQRSFEWYFWQRRANSAMAIFRGHHGTINALAFSPDGQLIVSGGADATARIWKSDGARELLALKGHCAAVTSVAFSPDGRQVLTGSSDQTAKLWDAATGREIRTVKDHTAAVLGVAFSHDGTLFATASHDRSTMIWEAATGKLLLTIRGHTGPVLSVGFSPDDRQIVTGSWDRTARVWDSATGREVLTLQGHQEGIRSVIYSPDGARIVTGSNDRTAKVWSARNGREEFTFKGHNYGVFSVAMAREGNRVISGSWDETAKIWDISTGREISVLRGHAAQVFAVALSPDGKWAVTGSVDQTARVWEVENAGGRRLAAGGAVMSLAFSADGRHVAAGCDDSMARIWERSDYRQLIAFKGHKSPVWHVAFGPTPDVLLTASGDPSTKLWSCTTGAELQTFISSNGNVWSTVPYPDGKRIVSSDDRAGTVREITTGKILFSLTNHTGAIYAMSISPDGKRLVTGSWDHTAKLWDAENGKEILTLRGHSAEVLSVAFSSDAKRIVTGSDDRTAKIWDANTGLELLTLKGHGGGVWSVSFSPDDQRIATGGEDLNLILWDSTCGKELLRLKGHGSRITAALFSPDGTQIASGSHDRTIRFWDTAREEEIARWRKEESAAAEMRSAQEAEEAAKSGREGILRAADAGSIKQWLVLTPIPYSNQSGPDALVQEQIEGEGRLAPVAGQQVKLAAGNFVWRPVELKTDGLLDFNKLAGETTARSIAYAAAYLESETAQTEVLLKVGSDDEARVYLNQKLVYECLSPRLYNPDQDVAAGLALKQGANVVVFKVVNETAGWQGSVHFTNKDGKPLPGIRIISRPR